jgi:exonuclease SbcD
VEWLLENPCLVELTLVSDTFFATQDLKRIHESHDGIIYIIPIVTKDGNAEQQTPKVNLDQDIQGLLDYFISKHKQEPNDELLDLFNEIIGSQAKRKKKLHMLPLKVLPVCIRIRRNKH